MRNKFICLFLPLIFLKAACAMEPITPQDENTRFYESIRKNDIEGIEHFYSTVKNDVISRYEDPLVYAARVGSTCSLKFILNNRYNGEQFFELRNKAFLTASFNGNIENLKELIRVGVDINYLNADINPIWASIEGGNPDAFRYLLSIGADYKFVNRKGENLLFPAVISGDLDVINSLIELGLSTNLVVREGDLTKNLKDYVSYRWKNNPERRADIMKLIYAH